jgi:uncharacterized membrane protein YvbJ
MSFCKECGNEVSGEATVCTQCGAPTGSEVNVSLSGLTYKQKAIAAGVVWASLRLINITMTLPSQTSLIVSFLSIASFLLTLYFLSQIRSPKDKEPGDGTES